MAAAAMPLQKGYAPPSYKAADDSLPRHFPTPQKRSVGGVLDTRQLCKALLNLCAPPMVFLCAAGLMSFKYHFILENVTWVLALMTLAPYYIAYRCEQHALKYRLDRSWPRLSKFLFLIASVSGVVFGAFNYWYYSWPSYSLEGLRTYTDIDASEVSGARLLDAGRVIFAQGSHIVTDLAMSYTSWDTYCVAPITTDRGTKTPDVGLSRYDMWAVGVGCCSPGQTNFHCGDFGNPDAREGLRLVDNSQLPYFQLAVQQAEAAYNLEVGHPMFFTWVEDSDKGLGEFFRIAFKNFVVANVFHMGFNLVCVITFVVLFAGSGKDTGLAALDEH
eukprot:gb/GFBE01053997.1/.p1 GENE.gb/GFBE01053997.1/~~gb/GFBE01053997.1/.p1  ORF type:complete len:331 (+),score=65.87 gb/GFBE01053997.1/:1-993(+)